MTTKEMMMMLNDLGIVNVVIMKENKMYVEDSESYVEGAYIYFDNKGNVIKIEK